MFCKTCDKRKTCKKTCEPLEKYLRKFTTYGVAQQISSFEDNAKKAVSPLQKREQEFSEIFDQDWDFLASNLGWD